MTILYAKNPCLFFFIYNVQKYKYWLCFGDPMINMRSEIEVFCLSESYIIKSAILCLISIVFSKSFKMNKKLSIIMYLRLYHNPCWPLYSLNKLSLFLSLYQVKCHQQFLVAPILNESKCSINMCHEALNINIFWYILNI